MQPLNRNQVKQDGHARINHNEREGGRIMTKSELISAIAADAGLTKVQAEAAVNSFIATVTKAIKAKDKVALVGFGTFASVERAARTGKNPQTGKAIKIEAKRNGKFTPGSALKDLDAKPAKKK